MNLMIANIYQLLSDAAPALLSLTHVRCHRSHSLAQAALRRIMETYSRVTRFCIICNYVSRIIEPVASRCAKFRFRSLEPDAMLARLRYIADQEELKIDDSVLLGACQRCL